MAFDQTSSYDVLARFIETQADALLNASELLGGTAATKRTARLIDIIRQSGSPSRHILRELDALRGLLSLENVGDPDVDETACFAMIDPRDPIVVELCMLHDELEGVLDQVARAHALVHARAA